MSEQRAYCRVYWSIVDDPKFAEVYDNDAALATWLRLLLIADQAYPSSAILPAGTKRRAVDLLARVNLIDLLPGWRYRVHGLDAERTRRSEAARVGGLASGRSRSVERSLNDGSLRQRTESNLAEPSQAETEPSRADAPDPADDYWTLTGKYPASKVIAWLDDLTAEYGAAVVARHLAARHAENADARTLLGRVGDTLRREARQLDRREQEAERARVNEVRAAKPGLLVAYHNNGAHEGKPATGCPYCKGEPHD